MNASEPVGLLLLPLLAFCRCHSVAYNWPNAVWWTTVVVEVLWVCRLHCSTYVRMSAVAMRLYVTLSWPLVCKVLSFYECFVVCLHAFLHPVLTELSIAGRLLFSQLFFLLFDIESCQYMRGLVSMWVCVCVSVAAVQVPRWACECVCECSGCASASVCVCECVCVSVAAVQVPRWAC